MSGLAEYVAECADMCALSASAVLLCNGNTAGLQCFHTVLVSYRQQTHLIYTQTHHIMIHVHPGTYLCSHASLTSL